MRRLALNDQLNYIAYHDSIITQTTDIDGCATGALIDTGMKMMVSYGAPLESETKDRVFDDTRVPSDMSARRIKIKGWKKITTVSDIKKELERSGTVVGIINLYDSFNDFVGSSPYTPLGSERPDSAMAHMISIIGYDDRDHTWIIRNSYGQAFGFNGLAKIRQGDRKLDLESDVYAPII
jgi:C1A family cysteine protease